MSRCNYFYTPNLDKLSTIARIISSMILFDKEISKYKNTGEFLRVKREEQSMATSLLRMMNKCNTWERN